MFSSIPVAILRGKTGFLVALFSLILLGTILTSLNIGLVIQPMFHMKHMVAAGSAARQTTTPDQEAT